MLALLTTCNVLICLYSFRNKNGTTSDLHHQDVQVVNFFPFRITVARENADKVLARVKEVCFITSILFSLNLVCELAGQVFCQVRNRYYSVLVSK